MLSIRGETYGSVCVGALNKPRCRAAHVCEHEMNTMNTHFSIWPGSRPQRRQCPLIFPTIQYHCFDNINHVLYHPTKEQTSHLACAGAHRPDEKSRAARHWVGFVYRFFTIKNAHTLSKRLQSVNPMNLPISEFITVVSI